MKKILVFQDVSGLERRIQKFKGFRLFQVVYEICLKAQLNDLTKEMEKPENKVELK